jgi:phage shock protein A
MQEKLKQLELLVSQAASRLQTLQSEAAGLRQKVRVQEDTIARLKESEAELKSLREWKRNTVSALKKLETRIDKEIARAQEEEKNLL